MDHLPGNVLIQNNRIGAVIHFADVEMRDPLVTSSLTNELI